MTFVASPSFQIIIPTMGGRERYLTDAIRSCLEQSYQRVEVIVSNNGASPAVKACVTDIGDKRIRYVETPSVLPMSMHWEFAIGHADADFVCILGDDDALTPSCVARVVAALAEFPGQKCVVHRPAQYYWPDYPIEDLRNRYMAGDYTNQVLLKTTEDILEKVTEFREWYGRLPFLYHGFVSGELIQAIKKKNGLFFARIAPDIYSDLVLAHELRSFIVIDQCLTVGGQGAKSNGANVMLNTKEGKQFYEDLPDFLRPRLNPRSIYLQLFEYIEDVRVLYHVQTPRRINWLRFGLMTFNEGLRATHNRRQIHDGLAELLNTQCPQPIRSLLLAMISLMSIPLFEKFAEQITHWRSRKSLVTSRDAAAEFCATTVLDVARHLDSKCPG